MSQSVYDSPFLCPKLRSQNCSNNWGSFWVLAMIISDGAWFIGLAVKNAWSLRHSGHLSVKMNFFQDSNVIFLHFLDILLIKVSSKCHKSYGNYISYASDVLPKHISSCFPLKYIQHSGKACSRQVSSLNMMNFAIKQQESDIYIASNGEKDSKRIKQSVVDFISWVSFIIN